MSFATAAGNSLRRRTALLQANVGVLGQKLGLITALRNTLGATEGGIRFAEACPVVGASIGQHFRHSMDHMERVASILDSENDNHDEIHYDIRVRGGSDEHDMEAAMERIERVREIFQNDIDTILSSPSSSSSPVGVYNDSNKSVLACFLLSGDPSEGEFMLSSTVERELGFSAHHAIHHLAMVKIITMHTLKLLSPDAFPEGFGKAPSTIVYDHSHQEQ